MVRGNSGLYINPGSKEDIKAVVIVPDSGGENTSVNGLVQVKHQPRNESDGYTRSYL
jgi:hypothetical protein